MILFVKEVVRLKLLAKYLSKMTVLLSTTFVQASSPFAHSPKLPESLKKLKK